MLKTLQIAFIALACQCDDVLTQRDNPVAPAPFIGSYKYYPNAGYYKFYKFKLPWGEAWTVCMDDNAHLVVIDSEKEREVVKQVMIESQSKGWTHIGVQDLFLNAHYITATNKRFYPSSFNQWAPKEPSNSDAENCVAMNGGGLLRDNSCNIPQQFICEYEENNQ